jgi:hypothetical protein
VVQNGRKPSKVNLYQHLHYKKVAKKDKKISINITKEDGIIANIVETRHYITTNWRSHNNNTWNQMKENYATAIKH